MLILVACEFSGIVRDAFRAAGHEAISCDLLPTERPGPHIQDDIRNVLERRYLWDMMIAFPPCTALCNSGNRWYAGTDERRQSLDFIRYLMAVPILRWAIENPVGAISSAIRRPDMILQPWEYGAAETKQTCLWLKGLPPLMVEDWIQGPYRARVHREPESKDRWKRRSRTYQGVAAAMAAQRGVARDVNASDVRGFAGALLLDGLDDERRAGDAAALGFGQQPRP